MTTTHMTVLAEGFVFLEGPRWHDGRLYFSDMWGHAIHAMTEAGVVSRIADVPMRPSGLCFLPDGSLITVSMGDRKLMRVGTNGKLSEYADVSALAQHDINDTVVDSAGNIYVGHFGYDIIQGEEPKPASLILVTPDGRSRVCAPSMSFPNGTVITPDGSTLICAETFASTLTAFDRAADGGLSNRRVWANLGDEHPDGICLDAEGAIWVSCFTSGQFIRVQQGGAVTHRIATPGKRAVACNLGGADGRTLFGLTYEGEIGDISSGARSARIEVCKVEVAAAGSP